MPCKCLFDDIIRTTRKTAHSIGHRGHSMNLDQIEKQLNKIKTDSETQREKFRDKLNSAERAAALAAKQMQTASDNDDPQGYTKAAGEHRAALDVIAMYSGKIKTGPMIDAANYDRIRAEIEKTLDSNTEAIRGKVIVMAHDARELKQELKNELARGNALFYRLLKEFLQDDNRPIVDYKVSDIENTLEKFVYQAERENIID